MEANWCGGRGSFDGMSTPLLYDCLNGSGGHWRPCLWSRRPIFRPTISICHDTVGTIQFGQLEWQRTVDSRIADSSSVLPLSVAVEQRPKTKPTAHSKFSDLPSTSQCCFDCVSDEPRSPFPPFIVIMIILLFGRVFFLKSMSNKAKKKKNALRNGSSLVHSKLII